MINIKDARTTKSPKVGDCYEEDGLCVVFEVVDGKAYAINLKHEQDVECPDLISPLYVESEDACIKRFYSIPVMGSFFYENLAWLKITKYLAWCIELNEVKDFKTDQIVALIDNSLIINGYL